MEHCPAPGGLLVSIYVFHHSSMCSSLAAPSLCLVSTAQWFTAKLKIRSLLYCFSPRLEKNICLLFDSCMSKNTHTHTHTHTHTPTVIHLAVRHNWPGWLRKTTFATICLFKKKAQVEWKWCFLLRLSAMLRMPSSLLFRKRGGDQV